MLNYNVYIRLFFQIKVFFSCGSLSQRQDSGGY